MHKEEMLRERYCQCLFASACFGPTEMAKLTSSNVMSKGEGRGVVVGWFVEVVVQLRLRIGREMRRVKLRLGSKWM